MFFDLILVVTSFRRSCHYLAIVKELSATYKIGLYIYPLEGGDLVKYDSQNKIFLDLLSKFGATVVRSERVQCNIMLLPQWHYRSEHIDKIFRDIECRAHYWDLALAMGNYSHENLNNKNIDKILIVDADFYNFRLARKPKEKAITFAEDSIVVVGTPYIKYPIFDDLDLDYIIANPTPYSFPQLEDKIKYLDNLITLLAGIPKYKTIAYKPHNAVGTDSLVHPKVYKIMHFFRSSLIRKLLYRYINLLSSLSNNQFLESLCYEIKIIDKYDKVMERVKPLSAVTPYHNLNLEVFFPNVRDGLITGRSNSIWHALHAKLPVYNCVSDTTQEITGTLKKLVPGQETSDKMHKYNMRYFNVGCCDGHLDFDPYKFTLVDERTRNSNIVDFLYRELLKDD